MRIPPIGGLISFVAAARHGSFTSAARELNLSQAAVSRRIRELEDYLGIRLFQRVRQRVVLTQAGELYVKHVTKPLDDLASASRTVAALSRDATLNLAVMPTFAARWLMPRLPTFQNAHPAVNVRLTTAQAAQEFSLEPFDAAVFHDSPDWPGTSAEHLMDLELVAVSSPKLNAKAAVQTPADIAKFPLLHLTTRPTRWLDWLGQMGLTLASPPIGHTYQTSTMVAQAAVSGLGIALMPRRFFEDELTTGRLEVVGSDFPTMKISYYLIVSDVRKGCSVVEDFAAWLKAEARAWLCDDCRLPVETSWLADHAPAARTRVLDLG